MEDSKPCCWLMNRGGALRLLMENEAGNVLVAHKMADACRVVCRQG
jgi:hypothetical protein